MSAVTYSKSSPYYATQTFGNFLDVMSFRPISKKADDVQYVIDRVYQFRPDILAHDLYGDSRLWWVFAARNPNIIKDPTFGFKAGLKIYIPKKETLTADLGI